MNNRLSNRLKAFVAAGSFWHKNMEGTRQKPLARALARLTTTSPSYGYLGEAVALASGDREAMVENAIWDFHDADTVVLDAELNARVVAVAADGDGKIYTAISRARGGLTGWSPLFADNNPADMRPMVTEAGAFILWPVSGSVPDTAVTLSYSRPRYLVPVPEGYIPTAIAAGDRELTLGIGFAVGDGFLVFKEPPGKLFEGGYIIVRSAWRRLGVLHDYVWRADIP